MKRFVYLYVFAISYGIPIVANAQQVYFNESYDFYGEAEVGRNVQIVNDGYYVQGGVVDSMTGLFGIGILYLDSVGNKIWKKSFGQGNVIYYSGLTGSFISTSEGGFALGGSIAYAGGDSDVMLWRFDDLGDTVWTKIYKDTSNWSVAYNCAQTGDGGFVLVGSSDEFTSTIMLMKVDSFGNQEWVEYFSSGSSYAGGTSVDVSHDGGYIIGASKYSGSDRNTYIIKTDSLGIMQWNKIYGSFYEEGAPKVFSTSDSGFIVATYFVIAEHPSPSMDTNQVYIIKLDSNGNEQWEQKYGLGNIDSRPTMIRELQNGKYVIVGQALDTTGQVAFVFFLNSQGDSLWYKDDYKSCDSNASGLRYFADIQATLDKGFVAVGYRLGACGPQDIWVVKMDSCGCLYSGCDFACSGDTTGVIEKSSSEFEFLIYPNPATENTTITYKPPSVKHNVSVTIYDLLGTNKGIYNLSESDGYQVISSEELRNGVYVYVFSVNGDPVERKKIIIVK